MNQGETGILRGENIFSKLLLSTALSMEEIIVAFWSQLSALILKVVLTGSKESWPLDLWCIKYYI